MITLYIVNFSAEMSNRIRSMRLSVKLGENTGIVEEGRLIALMQFAPLNEMPRTRLSQFTTLLEGTESTFY